MIHRDATGPLLDQPKLRHDAPPTSRAAAERVRPVMGKQQTLILGCLVMCGPLTDAEILEHSCLNPNSVRPRRGELVEKGLVFNSGTTRDGCIVWTTIKPKGDSNG